MLVELGGAGVLGQAVEIGEEVNLGRGGLGAGLGLAEEVVNQDLGMDLFLDVERRGRDDEVGPIRVVFAAPDELGVEVAIAAFVGDLDGRLVRLAHEGLVFDRRQVLALGVVAEGGDGFAFGGLGGGFGFGGHESERMNREMDANGRE